jgi:hypothetical protein
MGIFRKLRNAGRVILEMVNFLLRPVAGVANESKLSRNFPKARRDSIFHFRSAIANLLRPF